MADEFIVTYQVQRGQRIRVAGDHASRAEVMRLVAVLFAEHAIKRIEIVRTGRA